MTKLELLSAFLNDRLTAAAEEIFRAVKDTVSEYQSEITCAKEENERLQRLLNVAVQRLLLQPEPQPRDDDRRCDSEGTGGVEPLPQIKEEPKLGNIQTDDPREARDEGSGGRVQSPPTPRPPPARTACSRQSASPPPPSSPDIIKAESAGGDGGNPPDGSPSSMTACLSRSGAQGNFCAGAEKSRSPQRTNPRAKGSLSSGGKQNAHVLKSVSALRPPPPPRPPHSSQNIQRWHSCRECGKGFSFACQLEVHMRWHTKEKPYGCTVCRKSFTTVSMLKRHHRIHTGEKPFRCLVCGKCFNQSAHLNTHLRLHAREDQPEPGAALHVNTSLKRREPPDRL